MINTSICLFTPTNSDVSANDIFTGLSCSKDSTGSTTASCYPAASCCYTLLLHVASSTKAHERHNAL
ncbi:hypothetical protein BRADI_2g58472v3 [Brachypodium distachyon]|uniref:Uncharacterized protein n=1 Tax=Brachypodium distachyon TaxID=15368 RepID=A0A2K2DGN5_BRADI|nr:hypothetical protein BRADI_2g58472v3 [Brachypodium distachyon]